MTARGKNMEPVGFLKGTLRCYIFLKKKFACTCSFWQYNFRAINMHLFTSFCSNVNLGEHISKEVG